jgi:hypothetical protein
MLHASPTTDFGQEGQADASMDAWGDGWLVYGL